MQLVPRIPRKDFSTFQREMTDLFDRFFGETTPDLWRAKRWMPSVDLSETNGDVKIRAELPGLKKEDIDLDITGDILTISGEKKEEKEEERSAYHSQERYFGKFRRHIRLPAKVKGDEAKAVFQDGVLSILAPKLEGSEKRKIEISDR